MWNQWGGKQIDPKMPEWAAGRETLDRGMYEPWFTASVWT